MPWAQIDDNMLDCPKAIEAGPDATDLMLRSIVWCSKHMTDGRIPKAAIGVVSGGNPRAKARATRLVDVGWWVDTDDAWVIVDYLLWNRSKERIEADRAAAKARKDAFLEKARIAKEQKQNATGTHSEHVPNAGGTTNVRQPPPLPSPPLPAPEKQKQVEAMSADADSVLVLTSEPAPAPSEPSGPDPESLRLAWNANCGTLAHATKLTDERRRKATARLREHPLGGPEGWVAIIRRMAASDLCNGRVGDRGWRADFDFLIKPDTYVKASEGKYDNRTFTPRPPTARDGTERMTYGSKEALEIE